MSQGNVPSTKRRQLFAGAGTAGALVAAAAVLPSAREAEPTTAEARPVPEKGGGYQLTPHVLRYYQTAKV